MTVDIKWRFWSVWRVRLEWIKGGRVKNFLSKPESREKLRSSSLRWLEDAENDLRVLKSKRWKRNQTIETSVAKEDKSG
jgi:hypothetical protein